MRVPIIAGNWKMNTTVDEAIALVEGMRADLEAIDSVEEVICPPFISLAPLHQLLSTSPILIGAQDIFWEDKGAYTGEVSGPMLAPFCRYVIVGHSERRQYFGVTNKDVNRQLQTCIRHNLSPILCVGETLTEHDAGATSAVVTTQIREGLDGLTTCPGLVIAYEPIWAIGTGRASSGRDAAQVISLMRQTVGELLGASVAEVTRIQYGGSVTSANIAEFIREPAIDGALVGGASLRAAEFVTIVRETARIKQGI